MFNLIISTGVVWQLQLIKCQIRHFILKSLSTPEAILRSTAYCEKKTTFWMLCNASSIKHRTGYSIWPLTAYYRQYFPLVISGLSVTLLGGFWQHLYHTWRFFWSTRKSPYEQHQSSFLQKKYWKFCLHHCYRQALVVSDQFNEQIFCSLKESANLWSVESSLESIIQSAVICSQHSSKKNVVRPIKVWLIW